MPAKTLNENLAAFEVAKSPQLLRDLAESVVPALGTIYISTPAATVIPNTSDYVKVAGATTNRALYKFDMPESGRIRYVGEARIHVHAAITISKTGAANNQIYHFRIGKNGSVAGPDAVASEVQDKSLTGADMTSTALHFDAMLNQWDYLELFVRNETSATNCTVANMYFFVLGCLDTMN